MYIPEPKNPNRPAACASFRPRRSGCKRGGRFNSCRGAESPVKRIILRENTTRYGGHYKLSKRIQFNRIDHRDLHLPYHRAFPPTGDKGRVPYRYPLVDFVPDAGGGRRRCLGRRRKPDPLDYLGCCRFFLFLEYFRGFRAEEKGRKGVVPRKSAEKEPRHGQGGRARALKNPRRKNAGLDREAGCEH